ncbi:MAG: ATP-binding cassette domain-containing protein, partial [Sulfitobacter sp.]
VHRVLSDVAITSGFSACVDRGETVAITGPSGSGKSTLLLAIAGLYPIATGAITVGGMAISKRDEASLRRDVALLPQRSALMAGSVADCLRLAAPDADEATLWAVLEAVQLAALLKSREGLATMIGPRGDGLSGGEARRLVLARALLRNPQVLLLDEPTEGLDKATAKSVLEGVRETLPHAAILIASHRRIETDFADRIVQLK